MTATAVEAVEAVEQDTELEGSVQRTGWALSSSAVQNLGEVTAMLGGRDNALAAPQVADYLLRHVENAKAVTRAKCEKERLARERRWAAIARGERDPLTVAQLPREFPREKKGW